jgi:hypothetical protein
MLYWSGKFFVRRLENLPDEYNSGFYDLQKNGGSMTRWYESNGMQGVTLDFPYFKHQETEYLLTLWWSGGWGAEGNIFNASRNEGKAE